MMRNLVSFKNKLVEADVINSEATDLSTPGVSALQHATNIYEEVVNTVGSDPSKFRTFTRLLKTLAALKAVANEMEEEGEQKA